MHLIDKKRVGNLSLKEKTKNFEPFSHYSPIREKGATR